MNNAAIAETFLDRLRKNTSPSHTALEELPISLSIMNPAVSEADYALYLSLMHDVVLDTEVNIYPLISSFITNLAQRKKAHLITDDLHVLGRDTTPSGRPVTDHAANISPAFAMGIMYVVEGSSLGGRVILKNIKAALGYDEHRGAKYFSGYGAQTGSTWKSFLDDMLAYEAKYECENEIIAGADYAFRAISRHFSENSPQ